MDGGAGADAYYVDNVGDVIADADSDSTVYIALSAYTLPDTVLFANLLVTTGATVTGNGNVNWITGNIGNDTLYGLGGDDTLEGGNGDDTLDGGIGTDSLRGGEGDDYLTGGAGDDNLTGGAGNDTYYGGNGREQISDTQGTDTYIFTDIADSVFGNPDDIRHTTSADVFDFTLIDADTTVAGNQDFTFFGIEYAPVSSETYGDSLYAGAGNMWATQFDGASSSTIYLYGDVDGGGADFVIKIVLSAGESMPTLIG
ncbi:hypothetical protein H8M03_06170 [Sphingomonas sabuli]|uniref:Calcium-binding protein n=2 Tax=Sphingomonas sabuli TaxID=2764186 RepID=A0A7G9L5W6_9SPHN|nr:hypothetical protein H8M03_06170 [Sphingomonas sabuli]